LAWTDPPDVAADGEATPDDARKRLQGIAVDAHRAQQIARADVGEMILVIVVDGYAAPYIALDGDVDHVVGCFGDGADIDGRTGHDRAVIHGELVDDVCAYALVKVDVVYAYALFPAVYGDVAKGRAVYVEMGIALIR